MSGHTRRRGVVSTIIPVFNRPRLLAEAVDSVLAQTYRPIELIIADDGSTDETPAVAQAYAERHPEIVRYVRVPHGRDWRARNVALEMATGEFIHFLDSDDLIAPEKLATQVQALVRHPDCGISYCYVREYAFGDPPSRRPARRTGETFAQLFPALLAGRIWPYPSPLFRRSVIDAAGGGFLDRAAHPDWELEARIGALGVRLHHCRLFLAETRNTHALEGRRRSVRAPRTLRDSAEIHGLVLEHARAAGVGPAAVAPYAARLLVVARQCASIGLEAEARRTLALARSIASPGWRVAIDACSLLARAGGWRAVGGTAEYVAAAASACQHPVGVFTGRWRHRATVALDEVSRLPLTAWPAHLAALWMNRPSRRRPA